MITVIAGVNGAGKSSIAGSYIRSQGGNYFNPDEVARSLVAANPLLSQDDANSQAWKIGYDQLARAIDESQNYIFETTLGGTSICQLLHKAMDQGVEVRIFYCGLSSPDQHIERVAARVARGGHNIPEAKIRERWSKSIHNMMGLIRRCDSVRVFDNSTPANNNAPNPICLFSFQGGSFDSPPIDPMPEWAKAMASEAIKRIYK